MQPSEKPRVDFSLDNRQIFFLFFGLSVVGCFVFALGVMVGRQDLGIPGAAQEPVVAEASGPAGLGLDALADAAPLPVEAPDSFTFKEAIAEPATSGLPQTRDPAVPPRDEKALKAERAAREKLGHKPAAAPKKPLPAVLATSEPKPETVDVKAQAEPIAAPKADAPAEASKPAIKEETVMAAGSGESAEAEPSKAKRAFTLQLKAYASADDAEKMADKLRRNGHEVRVESADVQGRIWHRVRIGVFTTWDKAIEAKADFEKQEQVIAYVVPN
ncbi:MAG: SPOR domain-containing protein [Myxococcales bacterium]|nr:SPOR domain-containing protein [Myxococcales bacterium]MCB9702465.1 SPOR domain-containing protein [Myxococcales bacterium]